MKFASSIDTFNHFRIGALGLDDVVYTHCPHLRQACGVLGFIFTNTFLPYKSFKSGQSDLAHRVFKMILANSLVEYANNLDQCLQPARHSRDDPKNSVRKFPQTRTFAVSEALFCLQTRIHYECSADNCFSMQLLREAYMQANFKEGMLMDETHQRGTSDEEMCMNASVQCLA